MYQVIPFAGQTIPILIQERENMATEKSGGTQQSLDRALDLLDILAKSETNGLNISEISKLLGITRVTASTMVQSLLQRNYIEKDEESARYRIGYKLLELSQNYRYSYPFLYAAEGYVRQASEKLNLRINVSVLKSPGVAVLLISKDVSLLPQMSVGYVLPAYASASGKLLLANADEELAEKWLSKMEFIPFTTNTITNIDSMREELQMIRQNGIAIENQELVLRRCCMAAPIRNIAGKVIASVSFSILKERFDSDRDKLADELRLLSETISASLGYNSIGRANI